MESHYRDSALYLLVFDLYMLYSESTKGFYNKAINGKNIPIDAVEIIDAEYMLLLDGMSSGKRLISNDEGYPFLVDIDNQK